MSFSNAPAKALLGRVAGALAVDEAFVEKDWYVIEAIRTLQAAVKAEIIPAFSGGTSLLKGYGLIKRFSEDIDFKLILPEGFGEATRGQQRKTLGAYRDAVCECWASAGFEITSCIARDSNGFIELEMTYPSVLDPHEALRPHILAQLSAKPPRLPTQERPLASYVGQYQGAEPEVGAIACVDPVETAADKLSAFTWRALVRKRGDDRDDPTIVRHIHDLAALEALAVANAGFPALLEQVLRDDSNRGQGGVAELEPKERLDAMLDVLARDEQYQEEYGRFVGGMAFAGEAEVPNYVEAFAAVRRLSEQLRR